MGLIKTYKYLKVLYNKVFEICDPVLLKQFYLDLDDLRDLVEVILTFLYLLFPISDILLKSDNCIMNRITTGGYIVY